MVEFTKLKVLFVACGPRDQTFVSVDEEIRAITAKIRGSDQRDAIVLIQAWAVRPDDLLQLLNEHEPDVVHFAGHASKGVLAFVNDDLTTKPVSAAALTQLFRTAGKSARIVVLNACYTDYLAECLTTVVDSAIGMTSTIADCDAVTFAASFYRAIGFGKSVIEAVEQGVAALLLEGSTDASIVKIMNKNEWAARRPVLRAPNKTEAGSGRSEVPSYLTWELKQALNNGKVANEAHSAPISYESGGPFVVIPGIKSVHEDQLILALDKEIRAAGTSSIVFCDIDGLLGINAKYGVPTGNDVVRQSVAILVEHAETEHLFRVRGDQFVIFLGGQSVEEARLLAEACSKRIKEIPWHLTAAALHMSCTFSVAQCNKGEGAERCLLRLVLAAKRSKAREPGNVVVASPYTDFSNASLASHLS